MDNDNSSLDSAPKLIEQNIESYRIKAGLEKDLFHMIDHAIDVGISVFDENLNYIYINKYAAQTLKLTEDTFCVGDSLDSVHQHMIDKGIIEPQIMAQNRLGTDSMRTDAAAGSRRFRNLTPLKDGTIHRLVRKQTQRGYTISMNHDVTKLLQKEELLQDALTLGHSGYWTFNFKTKSIDISTSMRALLTQTEIDAIYNRGITSIIHPEDIETFKSSLKSMAARDDTIEYVHRNRAGTKWFRTTGKSERGPDGRLFRLRAFFSDITQETLQAQELEKAKDEAVAANIAKSEFLANMSHEIRTPMNGVLGMAELLEESKIDERQREYVNVITRSANALLTIINDILDFSKIEAGAFELDPMPFDLRDSVNDVAALLAPRAHEKGLELIIDYPPQLDSHFIADGGRLRQVLTNLIGNAVKFTEAGHVLVRIGINKFTNNRAELTLCVKDTGIGMAPETLETVFEKFTQADNSTTRLYGGTGLGLSISKRIIELMDGKIELKSTLGVGSEFTVTAPILIDPAAQSSPVGTANFTGVKVLIVDDMRINRNILTQRLKSWGMACISAKDATDALVSIKKASAAGKAFDIIISDFMMPNMNGCELATLIKADPQMQNTPIIMLSSCDRSFTHDEMGLIGIDSYLKKPVKISHLHSEIGKLLALEGATLAASQPSEGLPSKIQTPSPSSKPAVSDHPILVAEDFLLNQDVVRLMLADTPYSPEFANNGQEAVDMFMKDPMRYDAILMDISMPVMDGYMAAETIYSKQANTGASITPIIALTGHALKHDREKCLEAHMHDYLTKPIKQDDLIAALERWVKGRQQTSICA